MISIYLSRGSTIHPSLEEETNPTDTTTALGLQNYCKWALVQLEKRRHPELLPSAISWRCSRPLSLSPPAVCTAYRPPRLLVLELGSLGPLPIERAPCLGMGRLGSSPPPSHSSQFFLLHPPPPPSPRSRCTWEPKHRNYRQSFFSAFEKPRELASSVPAAPAPSASQLYYRLRGPRPVPVRLRHFPADSGWALPPRGRLDWRRNGGTPDTDWRDYGCYEQPFLFRRKYSWRRQTLPSYFQWYRFPFSAIFTEQTFSFPPQPTQLSSEFPWSPLLLLPPPSPSHSGAAAKTVRQLGLAARGCRCLHCLPWSAWLLWVNRLRGASRDSPRPAHSTSASLTTCTIDCPLKRQREPCQRWAAVSARLQHRVSTRRGCCIMAVGTTSQVGSGHRSGHWPLRCD